MAVFSLNVNAQTNILHLNLCSHNEMSDIGYGVNYNTNYSVIKGKALEIADSVNANSAKWNMQVESNFIRACLQFDNAANNSNDLMQWMDNLPHVEVDPHNHLDTIVTNSGYNPYNYADLNHLLDSCGLTTRTNIGGFIYKAQDWSNWDQDWTLWKNGLHGRTFPWVTWTPQVLWGGGTFNHFNDPHPSGIWHPSGPTTTNYLLNNPAQLLSIGNSCPWLIKDTTDIASLLNEINNYITVINSTSSNSNTFYTATIMFDFRHILDPNYVSKISEVLRGLKAHVTSGKIVWQTLTEKREDWLSSHNNSTDYFLIDCNDLVAGVENLGIEKKDFFISPNPFSNQTNIFTKENLINADIKIYNSCGQIVKEIKNISGQPIALYRENMTNGLYFIQLAQDNTIILNEKLLITD